MSTANQGDKVKIHYRIKGGDGNEVASTYEEDPIEIEIGKEEIWPSIESAIIGMAMGENKSVDLPADEGIPYMEELIFDLPREGFPEDMPLEIGTFIQLQDPEGQTIVSKIMEVHDDKIKVDSNHPLAGQALMIEVELIEVV
jgi:peptidylprolyl isomerase